MEACLACSKKKSNRWARARANKSSSSNSLLCRAWRQAAGVQGEAGLQPATRCHAEEGAPGERAQVHGDVPPPADLLLAL